MAERFVLVRVVNMRGVDLSIFDFDYDLTWIAFFLNANGKVYGRYGGRDEGPAEKGLSLSGLKYAMRSALQAYRRRPNAPAEPIEKKFQNAENFPAARRLKKDACIHCHQVYNFRREWLAQAGRWTRDDIWVYPPPENVGLTLSLEQSDRVESVAEESAAKIAGLRSGDVLTSINGIDVASYGDVQYALHRSPETGTIPVRWHRDGQAMSSVLKLKPGWRQSDISWRVSMWELEPRAHVYGKDLTASEKQKLGLSANRVAFHQGDYVPPHARRAGIRARDIIIGVDGKELEMNMLQFNVYIRLNYQPGDRIVYNVIREGKRLDIPMVLNSRYGSE